MAGEQLYAAALTGVPFLLLTLLADTRLFGPPPWGRHRKHRRWDATLDAFVLLMLAISFFSSLVALSIDDPPDLRAAAAYGLGMGAFGIFMHGAGRVVELYRKDRERS